jgi:hypothetical protein
MWKQEAEWVNRCITQLTFDKDFISCLNIGSSDRLYREVSKPFINELIFRPLSEKASILHVDIKNSDGVDVVGDFADPTFTERLSETKYDLILCNNLVTHVRNRELIFKLIENCIQRSGYLLFSAPQVYPYCADPYDAKYRPSLSQILGALPNYSLVSCETIISEESHFTRIINNYKLCFGLIFNILVPAKGIERWKNVVSDIPNLFTRFETICVVMRHKG